MTEGHNAHTPHPLIRYPVIFVFGPLFLAGALRSDPPFSAGWRVDGTALVGSLSYVVVVVNLLGIEGPEPGELRPKPGTPTQIEVILSDPVMLVFTALAAVVLAIFVSLIVSLPKRVGGNND